MSAHKQNTGRVGIRAGLLVGASVAILAMVGMGASNAVAAPVCPNSATISGKGSSLQKVAQEVWKTAYDAACSNSPMVEYTAADPGLEPFRFIGSGSIDHSVQFVGTDYAPNASQIISAEEVAGGAKPIIVPVSQTAIAVDIHPPTGCKFKTGKGITWADLTKIWGGKEITKWRQITNIEPTAEGGACDKPIKRVAFTEGAGTTYQFKNYLQTLVNVAGGKTLPCETDGQTTWEGLEPITEAGTGKPNTAWPECEGGTEILRGGGSGGVAAKVVEVEDSIGYSALPDTKAKGATAALLENATVAGETKFAEAGKEEVKEGLTYKTARCENARYTVPAEAQSTGSGEAVSWSAVFGAQPKIGGSEYPLCTLTYDVGWNNYAAAGYETEAVSKGTTATAWGEDVADYIANYIVPTAEGQKAIREKWYSPMPTDGGLAAGDVQLAAEYAASKLSRGSSSVSSPESSPTELEDHGGEEHTVEVGNPNFFFNIYLEDFSIDGAELEYTKPKLVGDCVETETVLRPGKSCVIHVKNNGASTASGTLTVKWSTVLTSGTLSVPIK